MDHVIPALYPGVVIGLLYGFTMRGLWGPPLGALGGLMGAAATLAIIAQLHLAEGPATVGVLVALSVVGAHLATRFANILARRAAHKDHQI